MLETLNAPHSPKARSTSRQRGLTLVELMIGVAFLGVLLAIAAPSFRSLMTAQRVRAASAELVTDIQYARSEAVRLNRPVILSFGFNDLNSCYTMYIRGVAGFCQCTRGAGNACRGGPTEIKTQSLRVSDAVQMRGASAAETNDITFDAGQGLPNHVQFTIDISSPVRGALRTTIGPAGSVSQCTPDGSISGVSRC